jgi:hypothetical protein
MHNHAEKLQMHSRRLKVAKRGDMLQAEKL